MKLNRLQELLRTLRRHSSIGESNVIFYVDGKVRELESVTATFNPDTNIHQVIFKVKQ